ncbi:MAG: hypothetical protein U0401_33770 [Anaerolineae bacterium]
MGVFLAAITTAITDNYGPTRGFNQAHQAHDGWFSNAGVNTSLARQKPSVLI